MGVPVLVLVLLAVLLVAGFAGCGFQLPEPAPDLFVKSVSASVGNGPVYLLTADLNGDGRADIVSVNGADNSVTVLYGRGDGAFREGLTLATQPEPSMAAVGDLNGDGIADLVLNSQAAGALTVFPGAGGGAFARPMSHKTGRVPLAVILDDFNNDGRLDAAVTLTFQKLEIHVGTGGGRLRKGATYATGSRSFSGVSGDFDGDGNRDIALAASSSNAGSIRVYLGNGDATFRRAGRFAEGLMPLTLVKRDMNGDGLDDLLTASGKGDNLYLFYANGDGSFRPSATFSAGGGPLALAAGDFNGDGLPDAAVANSRSSTFSVVFRKADGGFRFPGRDYVVEGGAPLAITSGDYNGDGRTDIAVAGSLSNKVEIYLQRRRRIS